MKSTVKKNLLIISFLIVILVTLFAISQPNVFGNISFDCTYNDGAISNVNSQSMVETNVKRTSLSNVNIASNGYTFDDRLAVKTTPNDDNFVYLGGSPIGILINAGGITILQSIGVETENGKQFPITAVDIRKGDTITKIDGKNVKDLFSFVKAVEEGGEIVELTIRRGQDYFKRSIKPVIDSRVNKKRLGILVKEELGGVGTLTFSTEKGAFGALGHRIYDSESGLFKELDSGKIYPVSIDGVVKGVRGKAGGLQASINKREKPIGEIKKNLEIGLYGVDYNGKLGDKIKVAKVGDAKMGHAQILTTVNGTTPKLYNIDIIKTVYQQESAEKGLVIAIKDKELIDLTGGIVQGMSGSPIIQNGMFVGAVTHVFISDPTRGYGIHSKFMVDQAQNLTA